MTSPSLLAMASPPPPPLPPPTPISMPTPSPSPSCIPIPRPPPPPSPPVNFGQFSRPIVAAKAILQKAGAAKVPSELAPNRKSGVENCPESKSGLTYIGSSGAPSHPTRRTSPELRCLREEVSLDYPFTDSGDCSEKTRNDSSVCLLIREFDLKAEDKKYSVGRKSGISKRRRVAKLHNTSEKRRRDRINEKIKTLQHLIPNSCKTDKSSILDEAIEYLKHLQHQIQYVSMQSGMDMQPLMLLTGMQMPNTYHRMGPMGMGMVTGLGMGMGHPLSQMASTQTIPGQGTTTSEQLHPSFYVVNPTNGYTGVQSSVINTPYDMHFAQSLVDRSHKQQ